MQVSHVTLAVADDDDGGGRALRGWLASAGPGTGWTLLPEPRSAGMGLAQDIAVSLDSAVAALTLYDRVRQWITSRGRQAKAVTVTATVATAERRTTVTVTLDPNTLRDDGGQAR
jgi:Effector Associated Constant Component 1